MAVGLVCLLPSLSSGDARVTSPKLRFHIPRIGRVEDWRANSSVIRVHYVSSPLLIERSGRISRTALPCVFHAKVYGAYHAGAAFDAGLRTR